MENTKYPQAGFKYSSIGQDWSIKKVDELEKEIFLEGFSKNGEKNGEMVLKLNVFEFLIKCGFIIRMVEVSTHLQSLNELPEDSKSFFFKKI
jgi:hypothetical protein